MTSPLGALADEARGNVSRLGGRFHHLDPVRELEEERTRREPGYVGAEAEVLSGAEAAVAVRVSLDVEVEGGAKTASSRLAEA